LKEINLTETMKKKEEEIKNNDKKVEFLNILLLTPIEIYKFLFFGFIFF
jgi:uncharacterized protein YqhQ